MSIQSELKRGYGLAYEQAYTLACEELAKIDDIEQQSLRRGTKYLETGSGKLIIIEYLNRTYQVSLPEVEISLTDSEELVPIQDKILLLHYFNGAKGTLASSRVISFKEIKEGVVYFPTFFKRAIKPLLDNFSQEPNRLIEAASKLGGVPADIGDAAVTINAFHHVPIIFVLWRGDEEFPPEGNIIFNSNISNYLPTEDIIVLCQNIAWTLVRLFKAGGDKTGSN